MGLITWWLSQDASVEPATIDATFRALAGQGTEGALGAAF